jgi:signal transduction histidine kinase
MAGFLFLLFGTTVLLISYFNVSILGDSMRSTARVQALSEADQVVALVLKTLPDWGFTPQTLSPPGPVHRQLFDYLSTVPQLQALDIFDVELRPVFHYGRPAPLVSTADLHTVLRTRTDLVRLVGYASPEDPVGAPLESFGPFSSPRASLELYRPISLGDPRRVQAVVRLSMDMPILVRRLQLLVLGNVLLAGVFLATAFLAINLWGEHAISRPIKNLLLAQERLGRGDYTAHVDVDLPTSNEMVTLCTSFNRMAGELSIYQGELEEKTRTLEQLNRRYRLLNERLEQEVEAKTQELREFFFLVTHDLRIPLAAIQGYTELLQRAPLTQRQSRYLSQISSATSGLLELVRNLLDAVRYDVGQVQMIPELFDLPELAHEVLGQVAPSEDGSPPRVVLELDPEASRVYADRNRIGRVLTNLLGNALRFSPAEHPPVLRSRCLGESVRIEVVDRGPGIPEEHLPYLFEKFRHFPGPDGPSSGMGLGLYIVRRILESQGSQIHVESRLGAGTRFWFELPGSPPEGEVPGAGETETVEDAQPFLEPRPPEAPAAGPVAATT